jgi:UDP-N-acetylmuramoyl-tripeptide--D-alanyl-D-alanine ligase
VIKRTLQQIQNMIEIKNNISSFQDVTIHGVTIDSRKIQPGNLFIPFKGEHSDGHMYVEAALKSGAAAALWQRDVPNPPANLPILIVEDTLEAIQELARSYRNELDVKVVGITGSNGKTTVKDMTANLLSLQYRVKKTEGNYNNHLGMPLTILALEEDTEIAVLEMGMSGKGEIEFLTKLARPNVAIITNIGEAHLQDLGSREAIAEAKLEIVQGLQDDGLLIYMGDETILKDGLAGINRNIDIQTFGRSSQNDLYPVEIETKQNGSRFKVNKVDFKFHLPVLGAHNVLNALSAMLAAYFFNIPYEKMNDGFVHLKLTQMRMELVEGFKGEKIINDAYNASPTSMRAAIDLISNLPDYDQKIVVLGDMLELGEKEKEFHYEMGKSLDPQKINYVFTFGPLAAQIAEGAKAAFPPEKVFSFLDKPSLMDQLVKLTSKETLILVKASRGMKLEEVVTELQK